MGDKVSLGGDAMLKNWVAVMGVPLRKLTENR